MVYLSFFLICQYFQVHNQFFCLLWLSNVFIVSQLILGIISMSLVHASFLAFHSHPSRAQGKFLSSFFFLFGICWKNCVMVRKIVCTFNFRLAILHLQQRFYKTFAENSSQSPAPILCLLLWQYPTDTSQILTINYFQESIAAPTRYLRARGI